MESRSRPAASRSEIHPTPQFRRRNWHSLNGPWSFRYDDERRFHSPDQIQEWTHRIEVPFAPESERSGVHDRLFHRCCWYQRIFRLEDLAWTREGGDRRLLLHFGAVDYSCRVWVNGQYVGSHEGGHTPFSFEITSCLVEGSDQVVSVRVMDNPLDLAKPRGKQDWQLEPHSIWYPRTTGIWQTVWLEPVPSTYIRRLRWTPHLERWEIGCEAQVSGIDDEKLLLRVRLSQGQHLLVNDSYEIIRGEVTRRIALSDPGIDDFRNELLWSPERPTLIHALVQLCGPDGTVIDEVNSYTALRSVGVSRGHFMLNGRPYYLRLVLDQGYWPESLMTAPSAGAFRKDIELTKTMGFNGVRKHQKIEDPVYLYYADLLGLLVWEEMPSAYRFTHDSVERILREWMEVINRDFSHPCVVTWVPFNESWGVPDLSEKIEHQSCVQALYFLTRTLDPTRPVIGNDGWESSATDIVGIHDYDAEPERLIRKYDGTTPASDILGMRRPAGRFLTLEEHPHRGQPVMLTEFGGIAYVRKEATAERAWGYSVTQSVTEFHSRFQSLMDAVNRLELFSGFCYTQLTDTFQEVNGLLFPDRTPKFSTETIAASVLGSGHAREERLANMAGIRDPLLLGNA